MRTRLSVCRRKRRFANAAAAADDARRIALPLLPYCCDRCGGFHLTSRTKGKGWRRPPGAASSPKPVD